MKRILLLLLIITIFFFSIFITIRITHDALELYIIDSDLIKINSVSIYKNTLRFSGYVIGNSFYGAYSRYEYEIIDSNIYITLYSNGEIPDDKELIEFEICDDKLDNVIKVYVGNKLVPLS